MTTFRIPRLRRGNIFDPPTPLDKFLFSPLRALAQLLYVFLITLRGAPFRAPTHKLPIRIVCISDTHTHRPGVPNGDVLIHAGDLSNAGTVEEIQAQLDWLNSLPHQHKIVIAGNHDSYFDPKSRKSADKESNAKLNYHGINYLENQPLLIEFRGGRKLNFYGSPDIPLCGGADFAFQYQRNLDPWNNRIPISTDVLITHTPPRYHLDNDLGCPSLLAETWRVKPRLHVFGHIHAAAGRQAVFWDQGQAAFEQLMARQKVGVIRDCIPSWAWIDALQILFHGVRGILWQHLMLGSTGANGGLLINAALVSWKTSDVIANTGQVIDL